MSCKGHGEVCVRVCASVCVCVCVCVNTGMWAHPTVTVVPGVTAIIKVEDANDVLTSQIVQCPAEICIAYSCSF